MRSQVVARPAILALAVVWSATAEAAGLPLPKAPVRILIPDVAAFDAALSGSYRKALLGEPAEDDPVVAAWKRTPVGSKLEDQWGKLAGELPWSWAQILELKPRSLGLAFFSAGSLEVALVVETPVALAVPLRSGQDLKTAAGAPYTLVARGAGDEAPGHRRMGLAWAIAGSRLFLATSEAALVRTLDESATGRGFEPGLTGLVALELDLDALRKDRYFRREFLFGTSEDSGLVAAALRVEGGRLVEIRQGTGLTRGSALVFEAPGAVAAAWEPEGESLWSALRAGLLEPWPNPGAKPVPPLRPLPAARATEGEDRYLVDFGKPQSGPGAPWEEGDLALWRELASRHPVSGWGYRLGADGTRVVVFEWPAALTPALERACRATLERRAGRLSVHAVGDAREFRMGTGLPAFALRRVGDHVWFGPSANGLADLPTTRNDPDLVSWARLDLDGVRAERARWERAEGPATPEMARPFSDRILGLLGWMPRVASLSIERRRTPAGWTERIEFGGRRAP